MKRTKVVKSYPTYEHLYCGKERLDQQRVKGRGKETYSVASQNAGVLLGYGKPLGLQHNILTTQSMPTGWAGVTRL